ncbi:MAG TPA: DUF2254 domain-containing protein [Streptosporangiaceae bacterium]|nr:DUF2254 domain-containing protein [Streptosporangiaceae bacterium]
MTRRFWRGSEWRREALRTNLWLVPAIEVVAAALLFVGTYALDRAAYDGVFREPGWVLSGSADAARQILTAIAAAIITVVGVVFSIVIVALTLTSTQFGPRMLRNFIRDRGTQITLGTFVATFVYSILALGSVGQGDHGDFVPHISITVLLVLMVIDLAVLIYFLHHIAVQIQLPQVIAGIAGDLASAIELQAGDPTVGADARYARLLIADMDGPGGEVAAPRSGYLQYIQHRNLLRIATEKNAVIHLRYRPGHFLVQGHPYATVWPATAAETVARELARSHVTGPYRTLAQDVAFGLDQLVEIGIRALSAAVNDTFTALTCIDWIGDSLCKVTGRWQPTRVYRDGAGTVRVIASQITYERLVQRAFEKVRQAGRGMPAVMIRQLDALAKIMERATSADDRAVLLDQATMIERLSERTVDEESDRADVLRAYQGVLDVHSGLGPAERAGQVSPAGPAS